MEQLIIKKKLLRCYFIANQQATFYKSEAFSRILLYVQQHRQGVYLKETEKFLILHIEGVSSMKAATHKLKEVNDFVYGVAEKTS
jgi:transcription-repair coupling factor (superfamily II helicase)